MPTYIVTDTDTGRKLELTGDRMPTEAELENIFATVKPSKTEGQNYQKQKYANEREELNALRKEFGYPNKRTELEALRKEFGVQPRFNGTPIDDSPKKTGGRFGGTPLEDEPVDFDAGEMISNIPDSAVQYGKDIYNALSNPVDTVKNLGKLAMGIAEKNQSWRAFLPAEEQEGDNEKYADAVGDFLVNRYGSIDAAQNTLMKDPVGAMADVSMVLTGGGSAAARLPGMAGQIGKTVQTAGKAVEPINTALTATKLPKAAVIGAAKMLPDSVPTKLYDSAAKFSTTIPKNTRKQITQTALENRIMPTGKGVEKAFGIMRDLEDGVDGLIKKATAEGKLIPRRVLYQHLNKLRKDMGGVKANATNDLKQINDVAKSFELNLKRMNKEMLTPDELQSFKRDVYKRVNYAEVHGKAEPGRDSAQKAMAQAAKEAIEKTAPGVGELNKQYGKMIDLIQPLQRSANRIDNRNLIGIDAPIKVAAGASVGGAPSSIAGLATALMEYPKVKARAAISIRDMQMKKLADLLQNSTARTATQQGLYQSGRLNEVMNR